MHFILIILLSWHGSAVSQQEYNTEQACNFAKHQVEEVYGPSNLYILCVPKGEQ